MRLQFPRTLLAAFVIWTSLQSSFADTFASDDFASATALKDNVPTYGKAVVESGAYQAVWYKYTAPAYGICTITVNDAPEPPPPPLPYTGGPLTLTLIGISVGVFENSWGDFGIPVEVYVKDSPESAFYVDSGYGHLALMVGAGVTYYLRVPISTSSRFQIRAHTARDNVSQKQYRGTFYTNKNFAHPAYLRGASCKALGYGQNAGAKNATIGNHALWWAWTAPSTGTTLFTTNGTYNEWIINANTYVSSTGVSFADPFSDNGPQPFDEFDPIVTTGTGSSWESFRYTRQNKEVFLKTVAGRTYRIAVGANHFRGTYLFSIVHWPKIPNDGSSSGTGGAFWNSNHFLPRTKMMQGSFFQPEGIDGIHVHVHGKARASHISYDNLSGVFRFLSRKTAPRSRTAHVTYTITAYHGNQALATVRKTVFLR